MEATGVYWLYAYAVLEAAGLEVIVVHLMGEPAATRHLLVQDSQAVLSPAWSIHAGCGTGNYRFIWGMAGENQTFDDMDGVKPDDLR
jgi:4-deoxy-L-threo-5-hexosulose-uronate ketol-isomerase